MVSAYQQLAPQAAIPQPTASQLRAARAMIEISRALLAERAGLSLRTVVTCERGEGVPRVSRRTLAKLTDAYAREGVEFTTNWRSGAVGLRAYQGRS